MTATADQIGQIVDLGGPAVRDGLVAVEHRLAALAAGEAEPLRSPFQATLTAGGKRLRPLLLLVAVETAKALGATSDAHQSADRSPIGSPASWPELPNPAVRAAVAVELLHTATLVHDDVLDRAPLRRGRPSVFSAYGRTTATALGDLMFARAFQELVALGDPACVRQLTSAAYALVEGELMQRADLGNWRVSRTRYLARCRLKTASLFEAACAIGAQIGGQPGLAERLGRFGASLGLAFQLLDDVLDFVGETRETGKRRAGDLLDGIATLPLIIAMERTPGLERAIEEGDVDAVCRAVVASGAAADTRTLARQYVSAALAELDSLPLEGDLARALREIARVVVERGA